jgi:Lon-like ATP-dependent protease
MAYGHNLSWRSALRLSQGRLRASSPRQLPAAARQYTCLNALPKPALPQTATSTARITLDTRTLGLRREFTSSALRLKARPPENKDIVEEEVEEETKRKEEEAKEKEHKDAESKLDSSGKRGPGESFGKPGEILKGGASAGGAAGGSGSSSGNGGNGPKKSATLNRSLQKPMVPDIYPQVMALPIAKRPLFPGFYKAVTIKDPNVAAAIQEMMKRGQPYIGAFLFKDEDADGDTIESLDEVHDVGVFAQVTSAFPVHGEEGALTAVLYPHRRIRITGLQPRDGEAAAEAKEEEPISEAEIEEVTEEYEERRDKGDIVASFEEPTETPERRPRAGEYATSFLKKYNVSVVDVENLVEEPHDKKEPVIRAVTSEIVNVFKEIANLNPLFRDQISTFSISHSTGNVIDEPAKLADFAAAVASGEVKELQEVLESLSVEERLQKALVVLKKELMNAQLQSKISKDVEAKIQKRQREYWLMEQMKGIKRELGIESDGKDKLVEKFKEKAEKLAMPEAVKKVFDEVRNCSITLSRGRC